MRIDREIDELVAHRVVLDWGTQADTIPGVLATAAPALTADERLVGLGYSTQGVLYAYAYDLQARRLHRLTLPEDLDHFLSEPSLSPDGRYLAYVAFPGQGKGQPVVRSWPESRIICKGPRVQLPASNYFVNGVEWKGSEFRIYMDLGDSAHDASAGPPPPHKGWLRAQGSLSRRNLTIDTVSEEHLR
ncbi:MAG: hypothetical protein M3P51_09760 [Chloroflexota bacterium]|nr:hypothetical protein [Chloroflexota bacterium]